MIKITESPRDAMQSFRKILSLEDKIRYINALQKVGFDVIDVGSFVSPKSVPQMADTPELLKKINKDKSLSKISVLVGNSKYAKELAEYECVDYINYPFSISEKFQMKNLNKDILESEKEVDKIIDICINSGKEAVISIAAAFGNPYGDKWSPDILLDRVMYFYDKNIKHISLADTLAMSSSHIIGNVFTEAIIEFPEMNFNFHLHSKKEFALEKVEAALIAGCRSFDTVYGNMGGCPMTGSSPTANMDTLSFISWLGGRGETVYLDIEKLYDAVKIGEEIFREEVFATSPQIQ